VRGSQVKKISYFLKIKIKKKLFKMGKEKREITIIQTKTTDKS
jgi:hypothetical protein